MAHEYEKEIKCPYCDLEFGDSWEHNGNDGATINCDCGKEFYLSVHFDVTYSTYKKDCPDENHKYGEPEIIIVDQELCDKWNKENFAGESNHKPYKYSRKECAICEHIDYGKHEEI